MKLKNLAIFALLTVGSYSKAPVHMNSGQLHLPSLTLGVDTTVLSSCPRNMTQALRDAVSYLRTQRKASNSWFAWIGDKLGIDQAEDTIKDWKAMVEFINTGKSDRNTFVASAFYKGLNNAGYQKNKDTSCISIPAANQRISPKIYLQAIVADLE